MSKNKLIYTLILIIIVNLFPIAITAQKTTIHASVDPVEIVIGQQSTIQVKVIAPKTHTIEFPTYTDTLITGIEVLTSEADTTFAHDIMTITKKYYVTSFDSTLYHIPYIPIIANKDTLHSNSLALKVITPNLSDKTLNYLEQWNKGQKDSLNIEELGAADIKPIQKLPLVWTDYLIYALIIILILLLIAAIIAGIYIYKRKHKKGYIFKPKKKEPSHVIALRELDKIKEEKLWEHGREKEYYTEITDVLREYIKDRFGINAQELTSDEILDILKNNFTSESAYESIEQVLKLSDLVKFATYKPLPNENDLSFVNSYLFVNQTKEQMPENDEDKGNKMNPENDNENNSPHSDDTSEEINWKLS